MEARDHQSKLSMEIKSFDKIYRRHSNSKVKRWFIGFAILGTIILFLPWTQNIQTVGKATTLYQEQRPQQLNSPIPGKIVKWYVKNGDFVKKGDTILQITEVKDEYLDPLLVERTQNQLNAKKGVIDFYEAKIGTTNNQLSAIENARQLKIQQLQVKGKQLQNKLNAEKVELNAVENELSLAKDQFERQQKMYNDGLVSLTQFQQRSVSYQNIIAKKTAAENKILQTQQDIINNDIEQNATIQDYTDKLAKLQGEVFSNMGQIETGTGEIAKLETQVSNYQARRNLYFIIATQDGQVAQLLKSGIGEMVKDGENIGTIIPDKVDYAVEINIKPVDLPLVKVGQKVMCTFDGFPAIVFSGWPNSSYGTFSGKIIAVENNIDENGYYKAMVTEDKNYKKWPPQLKIGTGVQAIAILNDVPIWYELWRNINGFPPDYYHIKKDDVSKKDEKKK